MFQKALLVAALSLVATTAFAGEMTFNPPVSPNTFVPNAGINAVNNINHPTQTPEQSGAVLESHDFSVKVQPQPRDDDDDGN
jgi:hypothetical protein